MPGITPVYHIAYPEIGEPIADTRDQLEQNAFTIEDALKARGLPPADLQALIADGWFSDSGVVTVPTLATHPDWNFTTAGAGLTSRRQGRHVTGHLAVARSTGATTLTGNAAGNVADTEVLAAGILPVLCRPSVNVIVPAEVAGTSAGTAMIYPTGRVTLRTLHATGVLAPGTLLFVAINYGLA